MSDGEHLPDAKPESTSCQEQPPEYARRLKDFAYTLADLVQGYGKDAFGERVKQFVADREPTEQATPSCAATALPPVGTPVRRNPVRDISSEPFETDDSPREIPTSEMGPCGPDLPLLRMFGPDASPRDKTLPEMYAILSAIHDVLCPEDVPIDPFRLTQTVESKTLEELENAESEVIREHFRVLKAEMAGAAYWALMADVEAVYRDMAEVAENGPPSARELADDLFRELERIRKNVEADLKQSQVPGNLSVGAPMTPHPTRPAVDGIDIEILKEMAGCPERCFKIPDLRSASRATTMKRLRGLLAAGFVEEPKGDRGGRRITAAGLKLVEKELSAKTAGT